MVIFYSFVFFTFLFMSPSDCLVIPINSSKNLIEHVNMEKYIEQSLVATLTDDGSYFFEFQQGKQTCVISKTSFTQGEDESVINIAYGRAPKPEKKYRKALDCCRKLISSACMPFARYWSFPQTLSEVLLYHKNFKDGIVHVDLENNFFVNSVDYQSNKSYYYLTMPSVGGSGIKEIYFDTKNYLAYHITGDGFIEYTDCLILLDKYKNMYEPIKGIKNAQFWNVPSILKNLLIFLKNYFYNARGSKRLKNSLREVFFSNAGKAFIPIVWLYFCILILLYRNNISCKDLFWGQITMYALYYIVRNPLAYLIG